MGALTVDFEPFRVGFTLNIGSHLQIAVEVVIGEILSRPVLVHGVILPSKRPADVGGVGLLIDPVLNGLLFGVADFCPAVVISDAGRIVGIHHRNNTRICFNVRSSHIIPSPLRAFR